MDPHRRPFVQPIRFLRHLPQLVDPGAKMPEEDSENLQKEKWAFPIIPSLALP